MERTFSILDLLTVIAKHKRMILIVTLIGGILVVLFNVYTSRVPPDKGWNPLPNAYIATAKIQVSVDSKMTSLEQAFVSANIPFASVIQRASGVTRSPNITLTKELAYSNPVLDNLVQKLKLAESFSDSNAPELTARNYLRRGISFTEIGRSGNLFGTNIVYLNFQDVDPDFAAHALSTLIPVLEEEFRVLQVAQIQRKKKFIEGRINALETDIESAKQKRFDFQKKYNLSNVSYQQKRQSELIVNLQLETVEKEVELSALKEYLPEDNSRVLRVQDEINAKRQQIEELRSGVVNESYVPLDALPALGEELSDLEFEVELQQAIYSRLRQEYEVAKVDEQDNSQVLQIIERPEVPGRPLLPNRKQIILFFTLGVFLFTVLLAFILEYFTNAKKDPSEADKFKELRASLKFRR